MARSGAVELDFFRMEKETKPQPSKLKFDRRRSFRDIQSVISKLNPEILRTVIASGSADQSGAPRPYSSVPSSPKPDDTPLPSFSLYTPLLRNVVSEPERALETTPMTIFYNGSVAVFDLPPHRAENILKIAEEGFTKAVESVDPALAVSSTDQTHLLDNLNGDTDVPIARRKSLQRFLAKRKERLTLASPYAFSKPNIGT